MKRAEAIELLAAAKDDGVSIVTMRAIGEWHKAGAASAMNYDLRGCMGAAAALGLGVALAQPQRRVMVLDGDGSLLMQLGGLASVAGAAPPNFYHFVFVNGVYETSGRQATPAAETIDFATIAKGAGYADAYEFDDTAVLRERLPSILSSTGPVLVALRVDVEDETYTFPHERPPDPAGLLRSQLVS